MFDVILASNVLLKKTPSSLAFNWFLHSSLNPDIIERSSKLAVDTKVFYLFSDMLNEDHQVTLESCFLL